MSHAEPHALRLVFDSVSEPFLALCPVGSRLMTAVDFVPGFVGRFIVEGLVIAGWAALRCPLDVLRCRRWPLARGRRLNRALCEAPLHVEFRDSVAEAS